MLTLRPSPVAYNLQMDWSLNPGDENKSEPSADDRNQYQAAAAAGYRGMRPQDANPYQPINAHAAVVRRFEESFRRFSQIDNPPRPNGHHSQSRLQDLSQPASHNNGVNPVNPSPNPPQIPLRPFHHLSSSSSTPHNNSSYETGAVNDNLGPSCSFTHTITQSKGFTKTLTTKGSASRYDPNIEASSRTAQHNKKSVHCTTSTFVPGSSTFSQSQAQLPNPSYTSDSHTQYRSETTSRLNAYSTPSTTASSYFPLGSQPTHLTTPRCPSNSSFLPNPAAFPNAPQLVSRQYDVDSISSILKSYQNNSFINSSIVKEEIKEEPPDEMPANSYNGNSLLHNGSNGAVKTECDARQGLMMWNKRMEQYVIPSVFGAVEIKEEQFEVKKEEPDDYSHPSWLGLSELAKQEPFKIKKEEDLELYAVPEIKEEKFEIKTEPTNGLQLDIKEEVDFKEEETEPITVPTIVDIEAELPCTSIKQRPPPKPKRKPATPRRNGAAKELKPERAGKEGSKRTSKRATNYCEDSSDEELKAALICANRSFLPIKSDQHVAPTAPVIRHIEIKKETEMKMEVDDEPQPHVEIKEDVKDEPSTSTANPAQSEEEPSTSKPKVVRNPAAAARNRNKANPLTRKEQMMMNKLMESQEPFLQNLPCLKISSRISKCRECRCASVRSDSAFCRFFDFRRLRFKDKSVLVVDGFSDPNKDPGPNDIALWMPGEPPGDVDLDVCRFVLMHVGDQFCQIWQEEQAAIKEHMSSDPTIAWKKVVKGVREICDVCETTLFNYHWTCSKCGFGVCIDCYLDRKRKLTKKIERPSRGIDDYGWLVCTFREAHEQNTLMLTQIIPGNLLNVLAQRYHDICRLWKIPQKCGCPLMESAKEQPSHLVEKTDKIVRDAYLRFFGRECEAKYFSRIKGLDPEEDYMEIAEAETQLIEEAAMAGTLPEVLSTTLKHLNYPPNAGEGAGSSTISEAQDAVTKEYNELQAGQTRNKYLAQKVMTLRISQQMFPGIDHDWLCGGKLLRLLDPRNSRNPLMFQEVWKRGQPVMVSELCKFLNIGLWHPEAFCRDFGEKKNDLINCMTGNLVPNQPMKYFWEGFLSVGKRLLDSEGQPMLLKLKDWPPGDDFAEILPTRFADLMSALPLPEYTLRSGTLNIASRLPNIFVPPDLGPKMYNAYGSALHPDKGTTNLHLDISDAVNIMVYVGIPTDASAPAQIDAAMRAIDGGGCDIITRRRVRNKSVMPGALWHIYSARDADKIRDLLNRVTIEKGFRLEPDHDPIHDQNWYLDNELRTRLYDDYGVEGYPIVQCLGDAVFIPAGAPHQVRNLHNCIKVAEDFVSPENIQHCFHLSQQFRKLSMSHTNHEDKLQIRNVIYHAVKDTTSYLTHLLNWQL